MATIAEQLASLAVTDSLLHSSQPASFTRLGWAKENGSWSASEGWHPAANEAAPAGSRGGYYWNTAKKSSGAASLFYWKTGAFMEGRQFAAWLFTEGSSASPTGYQCVALQTTSSKTVTVLLRKWVGGVETLLQEIKEVPLEVGGAVALVAVGGKVSAWVRKNASSPFALIGKEIEDATWTEGYSGFDGKGTNPSLWNFSTGTITGAGKAQTLTLEDSITLSDAVAKAPRKAQAEALTLSDGLAKAATHLSADGIELSDATSKAAGHLLADDLTLADSVAKAAGSVQADALALADALGKDAAHVESEALTLADTLGKAAAVVTEDTLPLSDGIRKAAQHREADVIALSDAQVKRVGLAQAESITLSDSLGKRLSKALADVLPLADLAKAITQGAVRVGKAVVSVARMAGGRASSARVGSGTAGASSASATASDEKVGSAQTSDRRL